jgi:hypothetical protein
MVCLESSEFILSQPSLPLFLTGITSIEISAGKPELLGSILSLPGPQQQVTLTI